jgi:PAS domain S-box-containing protein
MRLKGTTPIDLIHRIGETGQRSRYPASTPRGEVPLDARRLPVPGQPAPHPSWAARYGWAIGSVGAALLARLSIDFAVGERGAYLTFLLAVAVTAWCGGWRPALLATFLSVLVTDYFFVPPKYSFAFDSWGDVLLSTGFVLIALLIARIVDRLVGIAEDCRRLNAELERRVEERTVDLRKKAALLAEAERISSIGSWEWDVPENQVRWSDQFLRICAIVPQKFQPTLDRVLENVLPEDRERVREAFRRAYRTGEPFEVTHRIERPDGRRRTIRARGFVEMGPAGTPLRMYGSLQDVSEEVEFEERSRALALRESRERERARTAELAALMESVPAAILISRDAKGDEIVGNALSYEILGMKAGKNVSKSARDGDSAYEVYMNGRKVEASELPIQRAGSTGLPVLEQELEIRRADGQSLWIYGNAVPIFGEGKKVTQVVAAFVDVTERRRAEEKILELNAELERRVGERTRSLEQAMRELEAFSYTVAHDLRAPLRAMKGLADIVLEDAAGRLVSEEREYLLRITEAATRMDALVRDLLSYSRLGRGDLALGPVGLGPVVSDALEQLGSELRERGAQVTVEPGLPDVIGHAASLRQVITNLVSNAAKFVAPGVSPRIRISAQTRDDWTRLSVEDNGIGIAPDYHDKVFQVFEKLHRPEVYPGTGIGLAIVQRAVEKMGGHVGLESEPGKGTRFWLELPQAMEAAHEVERHVPARLAEES